MAARQPDVIALATPADESGSTNDAASPTSSTPGAHGRGAAYTDASVAQTRPVCDAFATRARNSVVRSSACAYKACNVRVRRPDRDARGSIMTVHCRRFGESGTDHAHPSAKLSTIVRAASARGHASDSHSA